jgi:hypothetical protein
VEQKKQAKRKPVHLNERVHLALKIAAAQRELTISEYANVLIARGLGILETEGK